MQRDSYREAIEASGFEVVTIRENTGYRFISERASNATKRVDTLGQTIQSDTNEAV